MKKYAGDLQPGDKVSLKASSCLGHALNGEKKEVELRLVRKDGARNRMRVAVWVVGEEKCFAWLRGLLRVDLLDRTNETIQS